MRSTLAPRAMTAPSLLNRSMMPGAKVNIMALVQLMTATAIQMHHLPWWKARALSPAPRFWATRVVAAVVKPKIGI